MQSATNKSLCSNSLKYSGKYEGMEGDPIRMIAFRGRYEAASKLIWAAKVQIIIVNVSPGMLRVIFEATE
jgi:hypothetical protein